MRIVTAFILIVATAAVLTGCLQQTSQSYDLVIHGGQIIDGSGNPSFSGDIGIRGDQIAFVGTMSEAELGQAGGTIDASGLIVSPGFIDIHSHSDYTLLVDGTARSKIYQGVTTEILGESRSAAPICQTTDHGSPYGIDVDWTTFAEYFSRLEENGISLNVGSYVGATQVRMCVLGSDSREPKPEEMEEMKSLIQEAMEDGALGVSSALLVPPNTYLTTDQLIEMASAVREYGGIYSTHIRSEGIGIEDAIREAIEVGEQAGVPVDIIHLKIADHRLWGKMPEVCQIIESARSRGLDVTANQYPYPAGQNNLVALIPPWAMEGGREQMLERLRDHAARERMTSDILNGIEGWFNHYLAMESWEGCRVASVNTEANEWCEGKSIAEISQKTGKEPTEVVFDLLLEEGGSVPAVYFLMSEEDIRYAMRLPWVSFGSDGTAVRPDGILGQGKPHPRYYGTFPRILGRYVRQDQVLPLEQAIHKMTYLNANRIGIEDRGFLAEGKKADITIFDPETVIDRATFEDPHHYAEGIQHVIVNGEPVLRAGEHLETRPGQILRRHEN